MPESRVFLIRQSRFARARERVEMLAGDLLYLAVRAAAWVFDLFVDGRMR